MTKTKSVLCIFTLAILFGTCSRATAGMDLPDIEKVAIQSNGKIIVGGDDLARYIDRVNADGSLDNTFNPGTGISDDIYNITFQSDGKILIGGYFETYNGVAINNIARINADGSLDDTFNVGTGANWTVFDIAIQSDGKIIIGGYFNAYNGITRNGIARLNTDGTLDTSFDPGMGTNELIDSIAIQSDGKIIIGGYFETYDGVAINNIARLNTNGTLDSSFNPGASTNDGIETIAIQSNGKILIGGYFETYNGVAINNIARINADGSLDDTFNVGTGANWTVFDIAIQSDGKIIAGGDFNTYNNITRNNIARINIDGTLDTSFNPGTGVSLESEYSNSEIKTIAIQSDGKIIIGGGFDTYNGIAKNNIARLNIDGTLDTDFKYNNILSSSIFRFFNKIKGNHFYTKSLSERDNIINNLSNEWAYEDVAYQAFEEPGVNILPLYRFWNKKTGFHFYTQNESEKNNIIATLSDTWNYENVAYYTYSSEQPGTTAVYRFFNKIQGNHFYTTSVTERNNIINNLSNTWNYENVAWYVPVD